ncbi:glycosyltransferase family 4 protein [Mucilaginibacter sp. McL0603]|uniref:glycosyltransferase family 4 protein n=1 Tax=Mucilaginibacter sp. McL0603 TaxID=3415670 RepID=UPI003CF57A1A
MDFKIYLDNIIYGLQKYGGISTYWKELQKYFIGLDNVHIITQSEDTRILDSVGNEYNMTCQKNKFIFENLSRASILRFLPFTKRLPAGSLYHASYYRTCLQQNVVNIYTVHDFTHKKGYSSKLPRKLVHITLTSLGVRNADGIICISENTRRDLKHYFPQIPENKIRVIYHGVSKDFFPIEKENNDITERFNLNSPFVIFIGKRRRYKNFDIVPQAVKQVSDLKLVVIGGGDLSSSEVRDLENTIPGRYVKMDNVNNQDLNILYNKAFALIYPSINEGFGLPIVEAMSAGCPVIATNLSSIPEVGGNAVLMINEVSSEAVTDKINLLKNPNVRALVIKEGFHQSGKFTWEKCFSETLKFYEDIYKQKFNA